MERFCLKPGLDLGALGFRGLGVEGFRGLGVEGFRV